MGRIIRVQPKIVVPGGGSYLIGNANTVLAIGRIGDCSGQGHSVQIKGDPSFENQAVTSGTEFDAVRNAGLLTGDLWGGTEIDGSDYFEFGPSADYDFGTGDFSIDFWMMPEDADMIGRYIFMNSSGGDATHTYMNAFKLLNSTTLNWYFNHQGTYSFRGTIPALGVGELHHVALTRKATDARIYFDGNQVGQAIRNRQLGYAATKFGIGYKFASTSKRFIGQMANFRVVKGSYIWDSSFNPPITKEEYETQNTDLGSALKFFFPMHGDTAFGHSSHDQHDIATHGEPVISAVTLGGKETSCIDFAGGGKTIDIGYGADDWSFGYDLFTIDLWFLIVSIPTGEGRSPLTNRSLTGNGWWLYVTYHTDKMRFMTGATTRLTSVNDVELNVMKHLAIVRTGIGSTDLKMYINGTLEASGNGNFNCVGEDGVRVGRSFTNGGDWFKGKVANIRITKGQALDIPALYAAGKLYRLKDAYT